MTDRSLMARIAVPMLAFFFAMPAMSADPAAEGPQVSDPVTHDNLSIYFIKGASESGPVPLTLDEALEKGGVKVHETQQVSELEIENTGNEAVLVHAGDIVKGGQQDRVLTVTILVPPKSGRMPIASYCVERGRWSARGNEDVAVFASSKSFMPSLEGKRAMRIAQKAEANAEAGQADATAAGQMTTAAGPAGEELSQGNERIPVQELNRAYPGVASGLGRPDPQSEVWRNVATVQSALGANLDGKVEAADSPTSLQLALENEKLAKAQAAYIDALKPRGESGNDVIGLVIAVNGELRSADIYPSNALFRKFWGKHINAAATEAIAKRDDTAASAAHPSKADVEAFLADAKNGKHHEQSLSDALELEVSEGEKTEAFSSRTKDGRLLHMNLLKK